MSASVIFEDCENFVDISAHTSMQRKDIRRGHSKIRFDFCIHQGGMKKDKEALQKCSHKDASRICEQFGRFQAKHRFGSHEEECILCRIRYAKSVLSE